MIQHVIRIFPMFAESKPDQMENNVRCMGNYLNYIQVLCNNINFYFHSFTHSFIMLIIYRTRRKEIKLYSSSSLTKWYEIQIKNTSYLQRAKKN